MQLQLKGDSLRRFDWRRGIFRGVGTGGDLFSLVFVDAPVFFRLACPVHQRALSHA